MRLVGKKQPFCLLDCELDTNKSDTSIKFTDKNSIASWSQASVTASVYAGLISGYPDNTFRATKSLTRAEAVVILDKASKSLEKTQIKDDHKLPQILDKPGSFGPEDGQLTYEGNLEITVPGVTLKNTIITGNLSLLAKVLEKETLYSIAS